MWSRAESNWALNTGQKKVDSILWPNWINTRARGFLGDYPFRFEQTTNNSKPIQSQFTHFIYWIRSSHCATQFIQFYDSFGENEWKHCASHSFPYHFYVFISSKNVVFNRIVINWKWTRWMPTITANVCKFALLSQLELIKDKPINWHDTTVWSVFGTNYWTEIEID